MIPTRRSARAATLPRAVEAPFLGFRAMAFSMAALAALAAAGAVRAQDTSEGASTSAEAEAAAEMVTQHGIATFPGSLKYGPDFEHLDYVNPDAPKGGEMSTWAFGGYDSMNPYSVKGRADRLSSTPYESLLTGTADEIGSAYGLLAESLTFPADRSEVTFTLRENAAFSDGSPVTAEDVLFSYEAFRESGLPSFRSVLREQVDSAEVIDERTIHFTFTEDAPKRDVIQTVGGLPVFSKAHYEENGLDLAENSMTPFLGSGPYVPGRLDVGQSSSYERNPDYWGEDLPINVGRNNFDTLRLEYFADYSVALEGLKGGAYTFRQEFSSRDWATGYDFPAIDRGWIVREELEDGSIATGQGWVMNLREPQFQDPRVRQAMNLLFNFEWTNEQLFYGLYQRVDSFFENSDLEATGLPSEEELAILEPLAADLPDGVLTEEVPVAPTSGARQMDRANIRAANALLDEAGWEVGSDGLRRKDGRTLSVEILNDSQTFERIVNPYVQNLRSAGIDASMERVDQAQATERERPPFDFDMTTQMLGQGNIPGAGLKQYFGSESVDSSVFNKAGIQSPAIDSLIRSIMETETQEELNVAARALDRVLRHMHVWVPQWHNPAYLVAYYDIFRHPDPLPPYALGSMDFWWYDAERAEELSAAGAPL
ncbi:extracellular solute-binding protein [Tropicimonas sp. IMCC34011]|uniref:extracellular solute-binding protein n=1 Tax=Tropicimonas sp. IMCC34011 TaxID=2248759 RepID=UPI001E43BAD4|nr:extracellular solute-binding protein [Tropicimonas sp. IMCC34011]